MANINQLKKEEEFKEAVVEWFRKNKGKEFNRNVVIKIEDKGKEHQFDFVSTDNTIAIDCKYLIWTKTGKFAGKKCERINNSVFALCDLPEQYEKYVVLPHDCSSLTGQAAAEYYSESHWNMLGNVKIADYNQENGEFHIYEQEIDEWKIGYTPEQYVRKFL